MMENYLKKKLIESTTLFIFFTSIATFFTYLFFYPFRRAYTAATYEQLYFWGINYKILIISSQVLGFTVSKGLGIKYVSEMLPQNRTKNLLKIILFSTVSYLFFGLIPAPYNLFFIFLANIPLGFLYGIVLSFLEGRKSTELLVSVLTASFIVGSGFAKSVGNWVLNSLHISEFLMPFVSCLLVFIPFVFSVWLMSLIPPPSKNDQIERTQRKPMNKSERRAYLSSFIFGIILFIFSYVLVTTFREFRDNFTPELWKQLGYANNSAIFTTTEIPIAVGVMVIMAGLTFVKNNHIAFRIIQVLMMFGGLLISTSTYLFENGYISPVWWLSLMGFGVYLAFSMSNSLYIERQIATFKQVGTIAFLITMADYYAYFGSILVLLYKNFFYQKLDFLAFFTKLSYIISALYFVVVAISFYYYEKKYAIQKLKDSD